MVDDAALAGPGGFLPVAGHGLLTYEMRYVLPCFCGGCWYHEPRSVVSLRAYGHGKSARGGEQKTIAEVVHKAPRNSQAGYAAVSFNLQTTPRAFS